MKEDWDKSRFILDLVFYSTRALLGEVRENMRKISIEHLKEEKKVNLYIYYSKHLTKEELDSDVANIILTEIISDLPDEDLTWEKKEIILPYPEKCPDRGICIFRRWEK